MSKYETHVEPRLDDIRKWSEKQATKKEIAKVLGISYSGFRNYEKKYPELKAALLKNETAANEEALGSFFRMVTGYEYKKITRERNEEGKLVVVKEVTTQVPPNVEAGKFWLKNKLPEEFSEKIKVESEKLEDLI